MGTVSIANAVPGVINHLRTVTADVTLSSSYATGGDTVALGSLGLKEVDQIVTHAGTLQTSVAVPSGTFSPNAHGTQIVLAGTPTAPKLKAYRGSTSEVTNATDLSAVPAVRVEFRGR